MSSFSSFSPKIHSLDHIIGSNKHSTFVPTVQASENTVGNNSSFPSGYNTSLSDVHVSHTASSKVYQDFSSDSLFFSGKMHSSSGASEHHFQDPSVQSPSLINTSIAPAPEKATSHPSMQDKDISTSTSSANTQKYSASEVPQCPESFSASKTLSYTTELDISPPNLNSGPHNSLSSNSVPTNSFSTAQSKSLSSVPADESSMINNSSDISVPDKISSASSGSNAPTSVFNPTDTSSSSDNFTPSSPVNDSLAAPSNTTDTLTSSPTTTDKYISTTPESSSTPPSASESSSSITTDVVTPHMSDHFSSTKEALPPNTSETLSQYPLPTTTDIIPQTPTDYSSTTSSHPDTLAPTDIIGPTQPSIVNSPNIESQKEISHADYTSNAPIPSDITSSVQTPPTSSQSIPDILPSSGPQISQGHVGKCIL